MSKSCVHAPGWLSSKSKADVQAMLSFCLALESLLSQTISPVQSNNPRSVGQSSPACPSPHKAYEQCDLTGALDTTTLCAALNNRALPTDSSKNSTSVPREVAFLLVLGWRGEGSVDRATDNVMCDLKPFPWEPPLHQKNSEHTFYN